MCVAVAVASGGALAQAFPAKPIEFVLPGSPGAGSDVFARLIADLIRKEKLVAQPIVITMARNLMEPVYMKGAEYGRYLAARSRSSPGSSPTWGSPARSSRPVRPTAARC